MLIRTGLVALVLLVATGCGQGPTTTENTGQTTAPPPNNPAENPAPPTTTTNDGATTDTNTGTTLLTCDSHLLDDSNRCTDDACVAGVIVHTPATNGTVCDDGDTCTIGDTCQAGICASGAPDCSNLTAVWANTGEDKVTRDELRATNGLPVTGSIWNGTMIKIFGAKNETVNFNLIVEAGATAVSNVTISFSTLTGPNGAKIASIPAVGDGVFNWANRPIELFYVRYLQIKGLSKPFYENYYDERHVPQRLRRPWTGNGQPLADKTWNDRPDHDKFYPDIAVPLEAVAPFTISAGQNQGLWVDVYIPKSSPAGLYTGTINISEDGAVTRHIPVQLTVRNFTLPDTPSAKTMLFLGYQDINTRYLASKEPWPWAAADVNRSELVRNRHFQMAHRHHIALIDADYGAGSGGDQPAPEWLPRLNGTLFTNANGYDGPGIGIGNGIYSIGTYGQFGQSGGWLTQGESVIQAHSNNWVNWFAAHSPSTEYFIYMNDECNGFTTQSDCFSTLQQWAQSINNNPGTGKNLLSMATMPIPDAVANTPGLDIPTSPAMVGVTTTWQNAVDLYKSKPDKRVYYYNSRRPISGSFGIEDDGVALRALAWSQYKKKIDRWFYWESTYYNNYQGGMGQTNVFQHAQTFGTMSGVDTVQGETGWNYSNGDGLLFYPGTDYQFPAESYGLSGPIASLRLKFWRRGIEDADYLTMAAAINPTAVQNIINQMIPKVLWEVGVDTPSDPTYVHADISWSINPDNWETVRSQLADIIEQGS